MKAIQEMFANPIEVVSLNVPRDFNDRHSDRVASTLLRARTVVPTSFPEGGRRAP